MDMNKKILLVLTLLLILLSGCNNKAAKTKNTTETETPISQSNENNNTDVSEEEVEVYIGYPEGEVSDRKVLYDEEGIKIELINVVYDEDSADVCIDFENLTGESLAVTLTKLEINGFHKEPYGNYTIPHKAKARFCEYIFFNDLEYMGFKNISEIIVGFSADEIESESDRNYIIEDLLIETNLPHEDSKKLGSNSFSVLEGDGIVVTGTGWEGNQDESYFGLYIKNQTENKLGFAVEDVMINGYVLNSYIYCNLPEDSGGFTSMNFSSYELEKIGVKSVDDIKNFKFVIYGYGIPDYEEVFRSGRISIDF